MYRNLRNKLNRKENVLEIISKNPGIRFNEIMRISDMRNGTLSHYVKKLEDEGEIELERSPRVTRIYPMGMEKEEAVICKFITIPTQRKIILFLLQKNTATAIQIRDFLNKSPSVVSVNLSQLFKAKIVDRRYDIPSNKFSLKNPKLVEKILDSFYEEILREEGLLKKKF